jgi:hypothetical protein
MQVFRVNKNFLPGLISLSDDHCKERNSEIEMVKEWYNTNSTTHVLRTSRT